MFTCRVHGSPAPKGSKRHVGNGVLVESSKREKPWREAVKFAALEATQCAPPRFDGPLRLEVDFLFTKPARAPKRRRVFATSRRCGDLEKLVRSTCDALVDAGVMLDDSQVVVQHVTKDYTDAAPGARIRVSQVYILEPVVAPVSAGRGSPNEEGSCQQQQESRSES